MACLRLAAILLLPPVECAGPAQAGHISHYAPGVMAQVIANRQAWGELPAVLPAVAGYAARPDCADIGRIIWLSIAGGRYAPFLVVDCASKSDRRWQDGLSGYEWMMAYNVLAEVDYETAVRHDCAGRGCRGELRQ